MIFWTNDHNIEWIIWFFKNIVYHVWSKTAFLLIFWQIEMKLLQVEMEIYHLKMHFKVVRHQMSHCYLSSKSKNNMRKWYFESFIADNFWSFNKKDPVVLVKENEEIKLQSYSLSHALFPPQKHFITLKEIFIQFHMIVVLEMILWSYKEGYY